MFSFNTQHFIKYIYMSAMLAFFSLSLASFSHHSLFINYKFPDTTLIKLNWTLSINYNAPLFSSVINIIKSSFWSVCLSPYSRVRCVYSIQVCFIIPFPSFISSQHNTTTTPSASTKKNL